MDQQISEPVGTEPKPNSPSPDVWADVQDLSCTLSVVLPMPKVAVGDLLRLEVHSILESQASEETPLPVWVNGVLIAWAEFDVAGDRLAIRITGLR